MRRLAQAVVGLLALALMLVAQPWQLRGCDPANCTTSSDDTWYWLIVGTGVYMTMFAVIVTVVLVGVLGMRSVGHASEAAVLAALGRNQASAARTAAVTGVKDGLVAAGGAFVLSGAVHVVIAFSSGYTLNSDGAGLWLVRLTMAVIMAAALVVAHVVDALRPRRTPVERLFEDAAAPRRRRIPLKLRAVTLGAMLAVGVGVLVGIATSHDIANGVAGAIPQTVAQLANVAIGLVLVALFFTVAVPLAGEAIPTLTRVAGRVTRALGATTASAASGRTVLAIAGLALITGALASQDPAPALNAAYVGTVTATPAGIGDELATEYAEIDGVGAVVPVALYDEWPQTVAVDPDRLAALDPELAALLRAHPRALLASSGMEVPDISTAAAVGLPVTGIVPISTCCMSFVAAGVPTGEPTGTALLVYAAEGADPQQVAERVDAFMPLSESWTGLGSSLAYYGGASTDFWGAAFLVALVIIVCAGPMTALAVGVAARRRRHEATLGALGASRRALTIAAVVETVVIAAVAVGTGLLGGAVLQAVMGVCGRVGDSLRGVVTDSYLSVAVNSVAWGWLAGIFAGTIAVFAVVAWIVSVARADKTPAELLRSAEARGL